MTDITQAELDRGWYFQVEKKSGTPGSWKMTTLNGMTAWGDCSKMKAAYPNGTSCAVPTWVENFKRYNPGEFSGWLSASGMNFSQVFGLKYKWPVIIGVAVVGVVILAAVAVRIKKKGKLLKSPSHEWPCPHCSSTVDLSESIEGVSDWEREDKEEGVWNVHGQANWDCPSCGRPLKVDWLANMRGDDEIFGEQINDVLEGEPDWNAEADRRYKERQEEEGLAQNKFSAPITNTEAWGNFLIISPKVLRVTNDVETTKKVEHKGIVKVYPTKSASSHTTEYVSNYTQIWFRKTERFNFHWEGNKLIVDVGSSD